MKVQFDSNTRTDKNRQCRAKPNCFRNFMEINSFNWASSQNVPEQIVKRNLVPPLRALLPWRASSHGIALSAELRLARRYQQA